MHPTASETGSPAVVVDGLVKRYRGRAAVDRLHLVAPAGRVTALLGPNGAGKTTTVECCEGLRRPDGGTVRVLGLDPVGDARALRPRVGVMLQDGGLPSTVPAGEVLAHVAAMYAEPWDPADLGDRLGLPAFSRTQVRRLSGGQRQRLALAAALVGRPEVAFLDEPSAGLDPQSRLAVWDLVRELRDGGTTFVVTTHQMGEAEALADHVVVVDAGRTLAAGTVAEVVGGGDALVRLTLAHADGGAVAPGQVVDAVDRALHAGGRAAQVVAAGEALEVRATPDPALVHLLTGWAADAGLLVTSLSTRPRTLEEVFLELTGRSLR